MECPDRQGCIPPATQKGGLSASLFFFNFPISATLSKILLDVPKNIPCSLKVPVPTDPQYPLPKVRRLRYLNLIESFNYVLFLRSTGNLINLLLRLDPDDIVLSYRGLSFSFLLVRQVPLTTTCVSLWLRYTGTVKRVRNRLFLAHTR